MGCTGGSEEAGMVETGRVAARDGEIAYHTAGDGPALVYLHGAGGLRWGAALDALATRFRVYALDLPGFGGSSQPDDVNGIPEAADMVAAAMAELGGGERMHLIGTSLGGRVAAWLAVRHADRVDRLVLESPAAFRPPDAPPLSALTPEQLRRALYGNPQVAPPTDDPAERQRQLKVVGRLTQGVMWDADLERGLASVEAATLVLFGTHDGLVPPEMGRVYKERIPEAYLIYVYGAAHAIQWDCPERYVAVVTDFLTRGEAFLVRRTEGVAS
jgi:pimeloyl-ACP methyl ester carboxylesterase